VPSRAWTLSCGEALAASEHAPPDDGGEVGEIRIGVSGWSYKSWSESFFPEDLPQKRQLEYVTRRFNTVEINGTFYSLQAPDTYARWYETAPADFLYGVKGSRFITHNKKLGNTYAPLANFFAQGVLRLKEKLGPILWQLPSSLRFREERVKEFLELLPRDTVEAARLAQDHDQRLKKGVWTKPGRKRRLRHALEPRNESFFQPELVRLLRDHGVGLVVSDAADWPLVEELTAGFVYVRLHGASKTYSSRYTDPELDAWADRIRAWAGGSEPDDARKITDRKPPRRKSRDVFVYFDNDQEAHAPHDALRLMERLGVESGPGE
jgi:uncharacterized protein YecE (DUF72 family)